MSTDISNPIIAKTKPTFLQRWAYWIIGGVVVIGFVNAFVWKFHKKFMESVYEDPIRTVKQLVGAQAKEKPLYVPYDQLRFANPELKALFWELYRTLRKESGNENTVEGKYAVLEAFRKPIYYEDYPLQIELKPSSTDPTLINAIRLNRNHSFIDADGRSSFFTMFDYESTGLAEEDKFSFYYYNENDIKEGYQNVWMQGKAKLDKPNNFVSYSVSNPTAASNLLHLLKSPELFLKNELRKNIVLKDKAQESFDNGTLFQPEIYDRSTGRITSYNDLSIEQKRMLFQQVLPEIEKQREYIKDHYPEIHAELIKVFPLRECLEKVYGPPPAEPAK